MSLEIDHVYNRSMGYRYDPAQAAEQMARTGRAGHLDRSNGLEEERFAFGGTTEEQAYIAALAMAPVDTLLISEIMALDRYRMRDEKEATIGLMVELEQVIEEAHERIERELEASPELVAAVEAVFEELSSELNDDVAETANPDSLSVMIKDALEQKITNQESKGAPITPESHDEATLLAEMIAENIESDMDSSADLTALAEALIVEDEARLRLKSLKEELELVSA